MTDSPRIVPDSTGCSHIPVCWFDLWICSRCSRPLDEVDTDEGPSLKAQESILPPDQWPTGHICGAEECPQCLAIGCPDCDSCNCIVGM